MANYKAFFTIKELSAMTGLKSSKLKYFLGKRGLLYDRVGTHFIVYPHDLRNDAPDFWKAVVDMDAIRKKLGLHDD